MNRLYWVVAVVVFAVVVSACVAPAMAQEEISTASGFQEISEDPDGDYVLVDDIDLSDVERYEPIEFDGRLDGGGYELSGLKINDPDEPFVGLFSRVGRDAQVSNLTVTEVDITGGTKTAGLAGVNDGEVLNTFVTGTVEGDDKVGGLVGENEGRIHVSSASVKVTGERRVGGLVGMEDGTLQDSNASGKVTGENRVGGLVGGTFSGVSGSYATGDVSGDGDYVGGIVGRSTGSVSGSYATGDVRGSDYVGGVVGYSKSREAEVHVSYATGDVTGTDYVGGLVGENTERATVKQSYFLGDVDGDDNTGGLVGRNRRGGEVSLSYVRGTITSETDAGGIVGWNQLGRVSRSYAVTSIDGERYTGDIVGYQGEERWQNRPIIENSYSSSRGVSYQKSSGVGEVKNDGTVPTESVDLVGGRKSMTGQEAESTMEGLNFDFIWEVPGNESYPRLRSHTGNVPDASEEVDCGRTAYETDGEGRYVVENPEHLLCIDENDPEADYVLGDNVDLTNTTNFEPIPSFRGSLRGNGYSIVGLHIDRPSTDKTGLFTELAPGSFVTNVDLRNVDVTGDDMVGGLVGKNDGTVTDLNASGTVSGTDAVGGLVGLNEGETGLNEGNATVRDSLSTVEVEGRGSVGGLVGVNSPGEVVDSRARGDVAGVSRVGGLVGAGGSGEQDPDVIDSIANGDVSGTDSVGGLVGKNDQIIRGSGATGEVSGESRVGGLVGRNQDDVRDSYAEGHVTGEDGEVGGLVGTTIAVGEISGSHATGKVSSEGSGVGGLVGVCYSEVTDSYATGDVSGKSAVGGVAGFLSGDMVGSYAEGSVNGKEAVGGLIGRLGRGEQGYYELSVRDSYWDVEDPEEPTIGEIKNAGETEIENVTPANYERQGGLPMRWAAVVILGSLVAGLAVRRLRFDE